MFMRFIIRYLANNEQLVQKLSESYPMRRAAQFVVRTVYHGKNLIEDTGLNRKLTPEQFRAAIHLFAQNLQKQIKESHASIKKRMK